MVSSLFCQDPQKAKLSINNMRNNLPQYIYLNEQHDSNFYNFKSKIIKLTWILKQPISTVPITSLESETKRTERVLLFRLQTRNNRLTDHMNRIPLIGIPEMYPYNKEPTRLPCVLQLCPNHGASTRAIWPQSTSLKKKLYGNLEVVRRNVKFIQ